MADQPIEKVAGVGKFNLATLNTQIEEQVNQLPKDAKGAIVGVYDGKSAHAAVVIKKEIGPGELVWSVEAAKEREKPLEWNTKLRYMW